MLLLAFADLTSSSIYSCKWGLSGCAVAFPALAEVWPHQLTTVELTSNYRSHRARQQIVALLPAPLAVGLVLNHCCVFLNRFAKMPFSKYTIANDCFKMLAFSFFIVGTLSFFSLRKRFIV